MDAATYWKLATRLGRCTIGAGLLAVAVAGAASDGAAATDPRKINPLTLTLSDWLGFRHDDRKLFMIGFALGWRGPEVVEQTEPAETTDEDGSEESAELPMTDYSDRLGELDTQIAKLANDRKNQDRLVITVLSRAMILQRIPLRELTGSGWIALPVRYRMLILQGVHGGNYSRMVWDSINQPRDSATVSHGLRSHRNRISSTLVPEPLYVLSRLADELRSDQRSAQPLVDTLHYLATRSGG